MKLIINYQMIRILILVLIMSIYTVNAIRWNKHSYKHYEKSIIYNGKNHFKTEAEAKAKEACLKLSICLGITHNSKKNIGMLVRAGTRTITTVLHGLNSVDDLSISLQIYLLLLYIFQNNILTAS